MHRFRTRAFLFCIFSNGTPCRCFLISCKTPINLIWMTQVFTTFNLQTKVFLTQKLTGNGLSPIFRNFVGSDCVAPPLSTAFAPHSSLVLASLRTYEVHFAQTKCRHYRHLEHIAECSKECDINIHNIFILIRC